MCRDRFVTLAAGGQPGMFDRPHTYDCKPLDRRGEGWGGGACVEQSGPMGAAATGRSSGHVEGFRAPTKGEGRPLFLLLNGGDLADWRAVDGPLDGRVTHDRADRQSQ